MREKSEIYKYNKRNNIIKERRAALGTIRSSEAVYGLEEKGSNDYSNNSICYIYNIRSN